MGVLAAAELLIYKIGPATRLIIVAGLLFIQTLPRFRRFIPLAAKLSVGALAGLIILQAALLTAGQYFTWKNGPFLPPFQPIRYFAGYTWQHFAKAPVFLLILAGAVALIISLANFFSRGRYFYEEEPYLAAAAILAAGWPNASLVIAGTIILALFVQLVRFIKSPLTPYRLPPTPFRYFWLPCALAALLWGDKIAIVTGLSQFRF